jgi:nucleoside-diphosphate-sugar epimerase
VHGENIVPVNLLVMDTTEADYQVFNVGTGRCVNIRQLVDMIAGARVPRLKTRESSNRVRQAQAGQEGRGLLKYSEALDEVPARES